MQAKIEKKKDSFKCTIEPEKKERDKWLLKNTNERREDKDSHAFLMKEKYSFNAILCYCCILHANFELYSC